MDVDSTAVAGVVTELINDWSYIRYDTIKEFNVDSKAEYSALSSRRRQKKNLKQTTPVTL